MSIITLRNGRRIGDFNKPYFIAELNTSHFGDLGIAKNMIDTAKAAGCDCVKFQSWSADTLYSESFYQKNPISKRIVKKFSLSEADLKDLSEYCTQVEMDFASTPYSLDEAKFLALKCNVPFIKIASMELNNLPYLISLGELGVPLILSTGMGTMTEIIDAVEAIQSTGNEKLIILHCTAVYPSPSNIIRLNNILGLRSEFPLHPIGYSDHSEGIEVPIASVALGACLIEKHFTLDSSRIGMDNQMATEPDQMKEMVRACLSVHHALGGADRILGVEEKEQISKMRRSLVAKTTLHIGEIINDGSVEFKRPGDGIPPSKYLDMVGKKVVNEINAGDLIRETDLS